MMMMMMMMMMIDASNFQPMSEIKHLGESYHVTFVLM